jgi:hypothetical protein
MSIKSEKKTYNLLLKEHKAVIYESELWKQNLSSYSGKQKMGLWNNSNYLDELLYIRQSIEKDMIPHLIKIRMKFCKTYII